MTYQVEKRRAVGSATTKGRRVARGRTWLQGLLLWPSARAKREAGGRKRGRIEKKSSRVFPEPEAVWTQSIASSFETKDSRMNLTSGSLRKRVVNRTSAAPPRLQNVYLQLLLCSALAILCLAGAAEADGADDSGHQGHLPVIVDNATSLLLPDQDCFFPYFKKYAGACVSHRYVNGQSFYYHVPKGLVTGYVVLIHGAGVGRSEDWYVRINRIPMMKRLIDYGFAVSAVQSVAQWTMLTRQRDLRNQDAAFWQIVRETGMDPSLPVFAVCVSRGCQYQGWMAETMELQRRPLKGQYMSIPWGVTRQFLARSAPRMPPTIVSVGGSDTVPLVNTPEQIGPWIDEIRGRGVEANLRINRRRNVSDCFHTLCKMSDTGGLRMTKKLVTEMRAKGVIDDNGAIIIPLPAMQGNENPYERLIVDAYMGVNYLQDWPVFSFDSPMIDWIYQELSELQGGHRHTSDFDDAVLNMFVRQTVYGRLSALAAARSGGRQPEDL